jgi:hypothetical protein
MNSAMTVAQKPKINQFASGSRVLSLVDMSSPRCRATSKQTAFGRSSHHLKTVVFQPNLSVAMTEKKR